MNTLIRALIATLTLTACVGTAGIGADGSAAAAGHK